MNELHFKLPIKLCAISATFFVEARKRSIESHRMLPFWSVLKEIFAQPQNLLTQKKFFLPVEMAEMATEAVRNGFCVIPAQNDEICLLMEVMGLQFSPGSPKSILISRGKSDFPQFLCLAKQAGIHVSVIAIDEPLPDELEPLVENWINIPCGKDDFQKIGEPDEVPDEAPDETPDGTPDVASEEASEEALDESINEDETEICPETLEVEEVSEPEVSEPEVAAEGELPEEPLSSEQVVSLLTLGGGSGAANVIPRTKPRKVQTRVTSVPKYESFVLGKATRIVEKLNDAIKECGLQKAHLENPESAESPVKLPMVAVQTKFETLDSMARIFSLLILAYDWLGRALSENPIDPKLAYSTVGCANCALRLLGMYYHLMDDQADLIYDLCFAFINDEVKTNHNQNHLDYAARKYRPLPLTEIENIEKRLLDVNRIYANRVCERLVRDRLQVNVRSLKRNPENRSEIFGYIMDDVHQLFTYFGYKPDNDFLCDLFRPYLDYFPTESEFSDDFYQIQAEIEFKKTSKELAKYTPSELANKYRFNEYIQTVRKNFEGGKLVVIGGIPKPEQKANFENAFGCVVEWEETSHGDSLDVYVPFLRNPEVRALMVLVQLSSHKHSQELGVLASKYNKPFFRVRTTNPIAAAKEIVEQFLNG